MKAEQVGNVAQHERTLNLDDLHDSKACYRATGILMGRSTFKTPSRTYGRRVRVVAMPGDATCTRVLRLYTGIPIIRVTGTRFAVSRTNPTICLFDYLYQMSLDDMQVSQDIAYHLFSYPPKAEKEI